MNKTEFVDLLEQMDSSDWQAVVDGQCLLMVDDMELGLGPATMDNVIVPAPGEDKIDADTLKVQSLANAEIIVADYYRANPLTRAGFDAQAERLMAVHGFATFAAVAGEVAPCTLFVDGGEVVAETSDSPRHKYGAFCELAEPVAGSELDAAVRQWLESGAAHEHYFGMNICRYHC